MLGNPTFRENYTCRIDILAWPGRKNVFTQNVPSFSVGTARVLMKFFDGSQFCVYREGEGVFCRFSNDAASRTEKRNAARVSPERDTKQFHFLPITFRFLSSDGRFPFGTRSLKYYSSPYTTLGRVHNRFRCSRGFVRGRGIRGKHLFKRSIRTTGHRPPTAYNGS